MDQNSPMYFPGLIELVDQHLEMSKQSDWKEQNYGQEGISFDFRYSRIGRTSDLYAHIHRVVAEHGYSTIEGLRLNIFEAPHYIQRHQDHGLEGYDTIIILVRSMGPRLIIERDNVNTLMHETPEYAIVMEPNTFHEVVASSESDDLRITICGWIK